MQGIVDRVLAPDYARLASSSREFAAAAAEFEAKPDQQRLEQAQAAWLATAIAAQELDGARVGPIADAGDAALFFFLPVRSTSVERAIAQLPAGAGEVDMEKFGAAAKGLCAAEYLLFPPQNAPSIVQPGEAGAKRRHYLAAVTKEMSAKAARIAKGWQQPLAPSAERFRNGAQDSLNVLINQMSMTATHLAVVRIAPLLDPENKTDRVKVPGLASGHSQVLLQAAVRGLGKLQTGGLLTYSSQINPDMAARLEQQVAKTTTLSEQIKHPLEAPNQKDLLTECYGACSALDILIKVEQASSLGVTLTFIASDGD